MWEPWRWCLHLAHPTIRLVWRLQPLGSVRGAHDRFKPCQHCDVLLRQPGSLTQPGEQTQPHTVAPSRDSPPYTPPRPSPTHPPPARQSELAYNVALCHYKLKQFGPSLKNLAEIIERGVREHPELSVGR